MGIEHLKVSFNLQYIDIILDIKKSQGKEMKETEREKCLEESFYEAPTIDTQNKLEFPCFPRP